MTKKRKFHHKFYEFGLVTATLSLSINVTYLQQRQKKTLEIGRELVQCTSLLLAIAVCANLDEHSHTCFQPAEIPLLQLSIIPQLLYKTRIGNLNILKII